MLIYKNGSYQMDRTSIGHGELDPDYPNYKWEVDDNSEVAMKVMSAGRPWTPIEDDNGNLIDIIEDPLSQEELNQIRINEIYQELNNLDNHAIRPLTAILSELGTDEDKERLKEIETQKIALRKELSELSN